MIDAVASPSLRASEKYLSGNGFGASRRRSAASTSAACARTPCEMRLVKKPTAVNDSTATDNASSSTASSPDFRSRHRSRKANRKIFMARIS